MEVERIALEFVNVYKKYKDRSFSRKKKRTEEGKRLPVGRDEERKKRLKINR